MSSNTANMVIFVLMVLLPLAAVLALEVFLSRRPSWWPGLVLPCSVTLGAFNMIRLMALNFLLAQPTLGAVEVVRDDERFCIYVPAEGAEYVHEKVPDSGFLKAFLAVVSGLEVSLDDILAVFHRFSDEVVCEKIEGSDEFDYLVYFKNGEPDGYRYCIKLEEDGCATYHRFIREDYEAFGF